MKKVIVGITGNEKEMPVMSGITFDAVSRHLSDGVKEAGGIPIIIPIGTPDLAETYVSMIDKLILSGGQNVDPRFYGEEKETSSDDYNLERDVFEFALVREALKQGKPIFAVCRGMQLLNVALGGTLNQDIANHWQKEFKGTAHEVIVESDSRVSHLVASGSRINSIHRQSVKELAPSLKATARDPRDGTIEAYESKDGSPLMGIQWHPELLLEKQESQKLFHYLVEAL
ncbi:gamma-glutamyl-gamma-aminobutyrate hydrolase family protein [Streptococcus loxodontisalivarius]|uniref:Glutamine amidotransferase n=1 Tax=Streptococcus loxodontisalivarius TaxID=1349415 RepID=A0ABS2PVM0_9STRE|nr:gamma-glutamyl-gamma-aminobutyrate hydrolase family protein [Streptococcus loxodontisalivarius]MBM7643575.1 putative glutamine amidotransferase [Streptococcus loxodontisalivarius]